MKILFITLLILTGCASEQPSNFYTEISTVCFKQKDQDNEKINHCAEFKEVEAYKWHRVKSHETLGEKPE